MNLDRQTTVALNIGELEVLRFALQNIIEQLDHRRANVRALVPRLLVISNKLRNAASEAACRR